MKAHLLCITLLSPTILLAQPTYTAADGATTIGSTPVSLTCDWMDAGPSGAAQTWDFSALVPITSYSETVLTPTATPYSASFPGANRASGSGTSYRYWTESAAQTVLNGQVSNGQVLTYTNTEKIAQFPLTMNTSWSDPFGGTFISGGLTTVRSGTYTANVDAWGTVVLPSGTFTNCLRLHYHESIADASVAGTYVYETESYAWLKPGFSKSLLAFQAYSISIVAGNDTVPILEQSYGLLDAAAVGIDEVGPDAPVVTLFPNPAKEYAHVSFTAEGSLHTTIDIVDLSGAVLRNAWSGNTAPGPIIHQLDLNGLAPGLYAVRIQQEGRKSSLTRLMVE